MSQKPQKIGIGEILGRSTKMLGRNFILFTLLALLAISPSIIQEAFGIFEIVKGAATEADLVSISPGIFILELFLGYFLVAVLAYRTFMELKGQKLSWGAGFGQALERFLPLVCLGIAFGAIVLLPFLAIIMFPGLAIAALIVVIPCIYALVVFFVIVPVAMIENTPGQKIFGRSAMLTKGSRWRIFVLILIIPLLTGILRPLYKFLFAYVFVEVNAIFWSAIVVITCLQAVVTAYSAVLIAVTYHDLRRVKGDLDVNQPSMM